MLDDSVRAEIGEDFDDKRIGSSFGEEALSLEDAVMNIISDNKDLPTHRAEERQMTNFFGEQNCSPLETEDEEKVAMLEEKELIVHDGNEDPHVGMEFQSEQAALEYYDAYAKRVGFIIRVGNCHRSGRDNSIISRRFLCNKEGHRISNNKTKRNENRKPRETTRLGCNAMIMVRREKNGRWVISKLEKDHCHSLGLPSSKARRGSVQARPQDEKDKKIRELTTELNRANIRLAECREQLNMILKDTERHTDHLSKTVQQIVENVKEIEADEDQLGYSHHITM
ncbi:hypothetical protein ACHQM5_028174 [Ranunculus cassubicifolius]